MLRLFLFSCIYLLFSYQPLLAQGQKSRLVVIRFDGTNKRVVYETTERIEAPNWTPDGKHLIFNSRGKLYRIAASGKSEPVPIPAGTITNINNDHGLTPDGKTIVFSAGHIYKMPVQGGTPIRITSKKPSYWHGISPDGRTLVYCAKRNDNFDVYAISIDGGPEKRMTNSPAYDDGPEYSPDGRWIYFNSNRSGTWEIWKIPASGGQAIQVTNDEYENWFPHPSPDGKKIAILSFPPGTKGHPRNKHVKIRLLFVGEEKNIRDVVSLFGGQGTINVPSWSPDSEYFAYVEYTQP